jgi:hypothetical protein
MTDASDVAEWRHVFRLGYGSVELESEYSSAIAQPPRMENFGDPLCRGPATGVGSPSPGGQPNALTNKSLVQTRVGESP